VGDWIVSLAWSSGWRGEEEVCLFTIGEKGWCVGEMIG
jgi:hypothetical protein